MNIHHIRLEEVDSTNNYLQGYRPSPGEDVTIVWTEVQTAGRGCDTNSWECEPYANLAFSVLFHPKRIPAASQFIISMANALALRDALSAYVEGITVKWPNDIYWKDYKMAGTLIEPSLQQGHVGRCIIGTGINVNQKQFLSDAPSLWPMSVGTCSTAKKWHKRSPATCSTTSPCSMIPKAGKISGRLTKVFSIGVREYTPTRLRMGQNS